jgi:hypothetical protein
MSKLSKKQRLSALQALLSAYKDILREWLTENNKKGVKYTVRQRREWKTSDGYSHWGEREYTEPQTIKFDGQISVTKDTLPWLSIKEMNKIFKDKGYESPPWEHLAENNSAYDRAVHLFDLTFKSGYKL